MKYYSGNSKPYIYAAFANADEASVMPLLLKLSNEGVLFRKNGKLNKRELKGVNAAHAVLFFVTQKFYQSDDFRCLVDEAVRDNKNILTIYLEDIKFDLWGHMQLDSAQTLSVKNFEGDEDFYKRLKESEIFRDMKVTAQQKRIKRNTVLSAVMIPFVAAALIYGIVIYPLLIAPAKQQLADLADTFGLKGLTQEELDSITEINIVGTEVYTEEVADIGMGQTENDGTIGYGIQYENGSSENGRTQRGNISDLSSLKALKNLKELRICGNNITDLSPLADCPNLERIVVENNPIRSLEGLENLDKLYELSINYTDVDSLSPIENLPNLKILCFRFTPVSEIPGTETIRNLDTIFAEGSYITAVPYLGKREKMSTIDVHRLYSEKPLDLSFLRDIDKIGTLSAEEKSSEMLRENLAGKEIRELNIPGTDIESLEDLGTINVTWRLDVCHAGSLVSLDGIEHFGEIKVLGIKQCMNLKDLTPCYKLKNLEALIVSTNMKELVENQLTDATFEIVYEDD